MLQSEFTQRVGVHVTEDIFGLIHEQYMQSDLNKDEFCKQWKKQHLEGCTASMVQTIRMLELQLVETEKRLAKEREYASNQLTAAYKTANSYAKELVRIYDIEGDEEATRVLFKKIRERYNNK